MLINYRRKVAKNNVIFNFQKKKNQRHKVNKETKKANYFAIEINFRRNKYHSSNISRHKYHISKKTFSFTNCKKIQLLKLSGRQETDLV